MSRTEPFFVYAFMNVSFSFYFIVLVHVSYGLYYELKLKITWGVVTNSKKGNIVILVALFLEYQA